MRVITFNTQGIVQATDKGLFDWLVQQDADVICLQDIRAREYQLDDARYHPEGYHSFFFEAWDEDYSGVAIYTREIPKAVMTGLGFDLCDQHGRFIQADFEHVSVASFAFPLGLKSQQAQVDKEGFMEGFKGHLNKTLRKRREFIFCGTVNIAHKTVDLSNWYANQTVSGFLPHEREWMAEVFDEMGFVDAFRQINKAERQFTWWPDYNRARKLNEGARLDYQITTANLRKNIKNAQIARDAAFSEHAPLIIDYELG
jgi:exodeoxyribonuclease-3